MDRRKNKLRVAIKINSNRKGSVKRWSSDGTVNQFSEFYKAMLLTMGREVYFKFLRGRFECISTSPDYKRLRETLFYGLPSHALLLAFYAHK